MKYTPPCISVMLTEDDDYRLFATNHGRTEPCGERIFRAEPWPDIAFHHATLAEAERDAGILRTYLDECANGKRKEKDNMPARRGWWMD